MTQTQFGDPSPVCYNEAMQPRRHRFKRQQRANIELTERDLHILLALHEHRFLQTHHFVQLLDSSLRKIQGRLRHLFDHHYLNRPQSQNRSRFYAHKNEPMVYALGRKAKAVLSEFISMPSNRPVWARSDKHAKKEYLDHTLAIAEFMIALEKECKQHDHLRFISQSELWKQLPDKLQNSTHPFGWGVNMIYKYQKVALGIIPDKVFALQDTRKPQGKDTMLYFLEMDRGTMSVKASHLNKSSIYKKQLAYLASWKERAHQRFGFTHATTLFVAPSERRLYTMKASEQTAIEVLFPNTKTPHLFRYGVHADLLKGGILACLDLAYKTNI